MIGGVNFGGVAPSPAALKQIKQKELEHQQQQEKIKKEYLFQEQKQRLKTMTGIAEVIVMLRLILNFEVGFESLQKNKKEKKYEFDFTPFSRTQQGKAVERRRIDGQLFEAVRIEAESAAAELVFSFDRKCRFRRRVRPTERRAQFTDGSRRLSIVAGQRCA